MSMPPSDSLSSSITWGAVSSEPLSKVTLHSSVHGQNFGIECIEDHFTECTLSSPVSKICRLRNWWNFMFNKSFLIHGIADVIFSDWDASFVPDFCLGAYWPLHTNSPLSTAHHLGTDGTALINNSTLQTQLSHFIRHQQKSWSDPTPFSSCLLTIIPLYQAKILLYFFGSLPYLWK